MYPTVINKSELFRLHRPNEWSVLVKDTMRYMMNDRLRIIQDIILLLNSDGM